MSILKQIFDGEYYPSEQIVPKSDAYSEKRSACNKAQQELEQILGNEGEKALTRFLNAYADVIDLMNYEFFKEGIRFGAALTKELQHNDDREEVIHE